MPWPQIKILLASDDDDSKAELIAERAAAMDAESQREAFDQLCEYWHCEPSALRVKTLDEIADGLFALNPVGRPVAAMLDEPLKNYLSGNIA